MYRWPYTINTKGITLLITACTTNTASTNGGWQPISQDEHQRHQREGRNAYARQHQVNGGTCGLAIAMK